MSSSRVTRSLFVKSFWNSEDADESLVIGYDCERTTSAKRTTVDVEMKHAQVTASASLSVCEERLLHRPKGRLYGEDVEMKMKTRPCHSQCLGLGLRAATSTSAKRTTVDVEMKVKTCPSHSQCLCLGLRAATSTSAKRTTVDVEMKVKTCPSHSQCLSLSARSDFYIGQGLACISIDISLAMFVVLCENCV